MPIALNKLLQYKNPELIARYRKDYPKNKISPQKALRELLKYFWLCAKYQEDKKKNPRDASLRFSCSVQYEMKEIDDMWHTFLLFTVDYTAFSKKYFGKFIHHIPNTKKQKKLSKAQHEKELTLYLSYIYDNLGANTLRTWFADLLK